MDVGLALGVPHSLSGLTANLRRLRGIIGSRELVALRYEDTLSGAGTTPTSMLFVEQEKYASEFECYVGGSRDHRISPVKTLFRGSLVAYGLAHTELRREAERADIVVRRWLLAPRQEEGEVLHYPMLEATLRTEADIEAQICRVRSKAHRHRLRSALRSASYRSTISEGERALIRFYDEMYEPYASGRFGERANMRSRAEFLALFRHEGRILDVTEAGQTVASALLVSRPGGVLSYDTNGFGKSTRSPLVLAQHSAALELAVMRHAIDLGFRTIAFGYARALFDEGLFTHKRRLGCEFAPTDYSPLVRFDVKPSKRAAVFQAFPLLAGRSGEFVAHVGLDAALPARTVREWRSELKNYAIAGLTRIVSHTNAPLGHPGRTAHETALREIGEGIVVEIAEVP